jgi:hypothetical protein
VSKIRKWWKNFLERLAEASKEEYGNKPPSCCDGKEKMVKQPKAQVGKK